VPLHRAAQGRQRLVARPAAFGRHDVITGAMRQEDATRSGTDIAAVNEGWISVTPLFLDLTHRPSMSRLAEAF
jgi:5'-nucleotidase